MDNKVFMWIFDYKDLELKDIVELADYEINIDEETNASSLVKVLKETTAKARDIVAIKNNGEMFYWGTIDEISNENGHIAYEYKLKYITNIFDQKILLENGQIIRETGVEDFIAETIRKNFIESEDVFINKNYLEIEILTHTPKETSVTNVEEGIYNLHTWMTNCTQNYDIIYSFSLVNKKLRITIENKSYEKQLIDTNAYSIANYTEVFETDVVAKVVVAYDTINEEENKGTYTLYLRNDRTTTTNMLDEDRADGRIETVHTEKYEDANQTALDTMKSNSYNHNITFSYNKLIKIGTPIAIKTKQSIIYNSYISSIKITKRAYYEYTCGNIRIKFIEKLLKERRK